MSIKDASVSTSLGRVANIYTIFDVFMWVLRIKLCSSCVYSKNFAVELFHQPQGYLSCGRIFLPTSSMRDLGTTRLVKQRCGHIDPTVHMSQLPQQCLLRHQILQQKEREENENLTGGTSSRDRVGWLGLVKNENLADFFISLLPGANMSLIYNSALRAPSH